jgi:hypothetical protein
MVSSAEIVTGSHRSKYFKRPIMPTIGNLAPDVLLAPTEEGVNPLEAPYEQEEWQPTKSQGIQTQFRDGEAQTDPYSPDFEIKKGEDPEVLLLSSFTHSEGLPIGQREVRIIEQARRKKRVEENLPPFTDEAHLHLRKRMLEKEELLQFKLREQEIDEAHEKRLEEVQRVLEMREQAALFLAEQKVETLRREKIEQREVDLERIRKKRLKVLRKLVQQRALANPTLSTTKKRDILKEYRSFDSSVYLPPKREGRLSLTLERTLESRTSHNQGTAPRPFSKPSSSVSFSKTLDPSLVMSMKLDAIDTLQAFERTLPPSNKIRPTKGPTSFDKSSRKTYSQVKEQQAIEQDIEKVHTLLLTQKALRMEGNAPNHKESKAKFAKEALAKTYGSNKKIVERPSTPELRERPCSADEDENEAEKGEERESKMGQREVQDAVKLLQRLVRGRGIQNKMFEERFRLASLIQELAYAHETKRKEDRELKEEEEEEKGDESAQRIKQRKERLAIKQQLHMDDYEVEQHFELSSLDAMAGTVFSEFLDRFVEGLTQS